MSKIQQQRQQNPLKLFKLNQKILTKTTKQISKNSSSNIINLRTLDEINVSNFRYSTCRQRKSFRDFLDSSEDSFDSLKIRKKAQNQKYLLVSYDDTIRPIHYRSKTQANNKYELLQHKQSFLKQSIFKTKMHVKQGKLNKGGNFYQNYNNYAKLNSKFFSKPISFKKMSINSKITQNVSIDWRPWTRRGQREQIEESLQLKP